MRRGVATGGRGGGGGTSPQILPPGAPHKISGIYIF